MVEEKLAGVKYCGGLKQNSPNNLISGSTIMKYGLFGESVALLGEMYHSYYLLTADLDLKFSAPSLAHVCMDTAIRYRHCP